MSVDEARTILRSARRLVVFTGAGVSADSGIDTFRTDGGLWLRFPPDEVGTPAALGRLIVTDPRRAAAFFHALLAPIAVAVPNAAHVAIAALERHVREAGGETVVITQNVDRLHQDAGSKRVEEVHGSLFTIVDAEGRPRRLLERADVARVVAGVDAALRAWWPRTQRAQLVRALGPLVGLSTAGRESFSHRPSVVLFGEPLAEPAWTRAQAAAHDADVMLVVGTAGAVYPAAGLPQRAAASGARVIGVGLEREPPGELACDLWLTGRAVDVVPPLLP